jgi:soluble lytic murein transglycosylase-like protein
LFGPNVPSSPLRLVAAATALAAIASLPGIASADIFTYTDDEGVVHYSNKSTDPRARLLVKTAPKRRGVPGVVASPPSDTSIERYSRYDEWIRQASILYQIPPELIRAVIKIESDYDARAVSHTGAQGLMQLMPETAVRMQVRDPFDPRENIFGGTRYLRVLANMFNGDLTLTVAGYNAGEAAVVRYAGIPPYEETQDYVVKVVGFYRSYRTTKDPVVASQGY